MKPDVYSFCVQKEGETESDCQDSSYPEPGNIGNLIYAIADGTTQSFYSRCWAQTLTRYFAEQPDDAFRDWEAWLSKPQATWRKTLAERVEEAPHDIFLRNGFNERQPAGATFVGLRLLEVEGDEYFTWKALVLGDSCLFHLRAGGEVVCYFKKSATDFTFFTESAQSYATKSPSWPTSISSSNGGAAAKKGDAFLLATDALSKWMLARKELGQPVWGAIAQLGSEGALTDLVLAARRDAACALENDDVALVSVRLGPLHPAYSGQCYIAIPPPRAARPVIAEMLQSAQPPSRAARNIPRPPVSSGPKGQTVTANQPSVTPPKASRTEARTDPSITTNRTIRAKGPHISLSHKSILIIALIFCSSLLTNFLLYSLLQNSSRRNQELLAENQRLINYQDLREKDAELRTLHGLVDKLSATTPELSKRLDQLDGKSKTLQDLINQLSSNGPQLSSEIDQFGLQLRTLRELIANLKLSAPNSNQVTEPQNPPPNREQ